jgi:membrane protease YdiL (CAAX protease family)
MLVYGILAYGISWGIGIGAAAAMQDGRLDPNGTLASLLGQIAATSPALAALVVIAAARGRRGIADFLRSLVKWRVGLQWYCLALLGIPIVVVFTYSQLYSTPLFQTLSQQWPILFTKFLLAVAFTFFATGLAEEPGWRGFALPGLQSKYGPLLGSLILGVFWTLWHLPNVVLWDRPMIFFLFQVMAIMISTFIHTWVYNETRGSVLIAMLLHASGNVTSGLVSFLVGANDLALKMQINTAGVIGTGALMILVLLLTRGRLGYRPAEDAAPSSGALNEKAPQASTR